MRFTMVLGAMPLLLTALAGCMAGEDEDDGGGDANRVEARDDEFDPDEMNVQENTTVTFENTGEHEHNISIHFVSEPANVTKHDEDIEPGQSTQYTFEEPGTYHVWCDYHGTMLTGMAMVVEVDEEA